MTQEIGQIAQTVRSVLLGGVLERQDPTALANDTPLLTSGVLDSVRTVTLISDLEKSFGIRFEAFEMSVDYLDSIDHIAATIQSKLGV